MIQRLGKLVRVASVQPLHGFKVRLGFADGTQKVVDLEPFLQGSIFEPIRNNEAVFRSLKVTGGTIAWDNGADIDPDVLYYDRKPAWKEQVEIKQKL